MSSSKRPLLMIPGPVEVSQAVREAYSIPPPSHLAPRFIQAFGRSIERMREVWCASPESQPFIVAGSGTLAMEMAVTNLLDPGDGALVVNTGYFSDRMVEMLRRRGLRVTQVGAEPGDAPATEAVERALASTDVKVLCATHVDTSTGVRVDARALAEVGRRRGVLTVFDGVCATAAERFEMEAWGADVYLTASQKAIGLPPGLALLVASPRAIRQREALAQPPPLSIDWLEWLPVMRAYEEGRPSYFSTPATSLVMGLERALSEILETRVGDRVGIEARVALHERAAEALRGVWRELGLELVPARAELAANTLSALRIPEGLGGGLVAAIAARGVIVAGGLHPALKSTTFRVGHMGLSATRVDHLERAVEAIESALISVGHDVAEGTGKRVLRAELTGDGAR